MPDGPAFIYEQNQLINNESVYTHIYKFGNVKELLARFEEYCLVDMQLSRITTKGYIYTIQRFLQDRNIKDITQDDIRSYLRWYSENRSKKTYSNLLCAFMAFFREFAKAPWLVESFRFPELDTFNPKQIPTKEQLRKFFIHLPLRSQALFLVLATSGIRLGEALSLERDDIKGNLVDTSKAHRNQTTKRSWFSFINDEAVTVVTKYLRSHQRNRIFCNIKKHQIDFRKASITSRMKITAKDLRDFFAEEMTNQGMAERYVDFMQGRTPKKVLARNYSDYSIEKMKERYQRAGIRLGIVQSYRQKPSNFLAIKFQR